MQSFIKKLLVFLIPILLYLVAEAFLPVTTFTHRHFEALRFRTVVPHRYAWYPNINSSMKAVGDLCHHTKHAIVKHEHWITDKYGFRNIKFVSNPDILIVGDSFTQGTSLSQNETITFQLIKNSKGDLKVYNMAPSSMSEFYQWYASGKIQKPKILIFSISERSGVRKIESPDNTELRKIKNVVISLFEIADLNVYIDKALRNYSLKWLSARIEGHHGRGVASPIEPSFFFLNGTDQVYRNPHLLRTAEQLKSYQNFCEKNGIEFIFLPMPNKETVYFDLVPFSTQPEYLFKLDSVLDLKNITSINTLKIYNEFRAVNDHLLYHKDDSHWNSIATDLVSKEILRLLND